MSTKPKILITSAAGKTGMQTALQLLEKDYPVRAMVRRKDRRAELLEGAGAEIFVGDQYSVVDMRRAMSGIQRAYHCAPGAANGLHHGMVFAIAAQENRIEHIVSLSQWLAQPNHPSMYTREVWLSEAVMNLLPDTTHTVNNVGWFADNYFMVLEPAAQLGLLPMPLGDGSVAKNAPPSLRDIAAVNVGALLDPQTHAGKTYRPTGPALLSPNDVAAVLGKVLGRKVKYQNISDTMLLKAMTATPPSEFAASPAMLTQLLYYAEEYRRGAFAVAGPTSDVADVAGRAPEFFEETVRRAVGQHPEATRTLGNKLTAIKNFIKLLATPAPDVAKVEARLNHVILAAPEYCRDNHEWMQSHDPDAGFGHNQPGGNTAPAPHLREVAQ